MNHDWRRVVGPIVAISVLGILSGCGTPDRLQQTAGSATTPPTVGIGSAAPPTVASSAAPPPTVSIDNAVAAPTSSANIALSPTASSCPTAAQVTAIEHSTHPMVDYVVDTTLQQKVAESPLIVVATLHALGGIVNMSRDVVDATRPSSTDFAIGQIYHFTVQRYLNGSGPPTITLVQYEGMVLFPPACVTPAMIASARAHDNYAAFSSHDTYLLLLHRLDGFDPRLGYVTGGKAPWRFRMHPDGSAVMEGEPGAIDMVPATFWPAGQRPVQEQVIHEVQRQQAHPVTATP